MNKLKDFRIKNKYTQAMLSELLDITQSQYSKLERGTSVLNANQLVLLSNLYKCTPNDLLDYKQLHQIILATDYED